jgi:hypothetical protein
MVVPQPDLRPRTTRRGSRRARLAVGVVLLAVLVSACVVDPPPPPPPPPPPEVCDPPAGSHAGSVPVMGACPRVTVDQIVAWFQWRTNGGTAPTYRALVPLRDLVVLFVEEGRAEGVRGDLAFVQSVVETGWFAFAGRVPPSANNFSGFGATDGTTDYGVFPDARTGVRAQIQHLRAYADPTATSCTVPPLHNPCVNPRFGFVVPKGKAPTWNQFGSGNWATDPTYAGKILSLYTELLGRSGLPLA